MSSAKTMANNGDGITANITPRIIYLIVCSFLYHLIIELAGFASKFADYPHQRWAIKPCRPKNTGVSEFIKVIFSIPRRSRLYTTG
ncbi:hypothetical protein J4732_19120 [Serratia marcescens]|uniref:Uncharacterized protein n=1 Tax=Serratia marcescens TaxID=615 RepID=A0A939NQV5_SERMA|nr:hypothetical protein [Serratia marcescens]